MQQLIARKPFSWAHRGVHVQHFQPGDVIEPQDDDIVRVAVAEGWAAPDADGDGAPDAPQRRARRAAPENK